MLTSVKVNYCAKLSYKIWSACDCDVAFACVIFSHRGARGLIFQALDATWRPEHCWRSSFLHGVFTVIRMHRMQDAPDAGCTGCRMQPELASSHSLVKIWYVWVGVSVGMSFAHNGSPPWLLLIPRSSQSWASTCIHGSTKTDPPWSLKPLHGVRAIYHTHHMRE